MGASSFLKSKSCATGLVMACVTMMSASASATVIDVQSEYRGWYEEGGIHFSSNYNYLVGYAPENPYDYYRNFFVFDLSGVTEEVTSATLSLYNPSTELDGKDGANGSGIYTLFDVSTSVYEFSSTETYQDLGSGISYGGVSFSLSDNGDFINILLNSDALTAINNAGGSFTLGGAVTSGENYVFAWTHHGGNYPGDGWSFLSLTTVPEPATLAIFGMGLIGMGAAGRRRRKS